MKKACLLLLSCICIAFISKAQDTITLTNGSNILAKVLEINPENVKYKDYNNQDGPVITILRKGVLAIKYANGSKTTFRPDDNEGSGGDSRNGGRKAVKKNVHVHGWYFGANLSIGASNASSQDPSYSVGGLVYAGDGLFAVKMFNPHLGLQFGFLSEDFTYRVGFFAGGVDEDIFTITTITVPLRLVYLSNDKKKIGIYGMAGFDFSVVSSAKDQDGNSLTDYVRSTLISPYLSAGLEFRTRRASTVFFVGPYFKTNLGNFYTGNYNTSIGLAAGNKGNLSSFGLTLSCMTNFGRRK